MDKRFSQRKSGKVLAAAAASVGLAGFASQTHASLVIDVRALGITAGGGTISADKKSVNLNPGGATITMGVFARVSGTNATQQTGEFGGGGGDDLRNDDGVNIVTGSFQSVGPLLGNFGIGAAPGAQVSPSSRVTPFADSGSQNGVSADWDSDGDLDIGTNGTDPTNMFVGRSPTSAHALLFGPTASPVPNGKGWSQDAGGSGFNNNDTIIDPTTSELQIGTLRWVTSGAGGASSALNFVPRPTTDAGSALWFEDGQATGKSPGSGAYLLGAPVTVTNAPEPAALSLLGIAGLGLLARRRDSKSNA